MSTDTRAGTSADGARAEEITEVLGATAPPSRGDRAGASRPLAERPGNAVTAVIRRTRAPRVPGGSGGRRPPRAPRPARTRLPLPVPQPKAPRDGRWWAGAAILTASLLLLSFVAHVAVFSAAQHHRAQTLAYDELREGLALGTTPVNQVQTEGADGIDQAALVPAGTPVALLEAPAIGLSEVVLEGTGADVLRSGIGHRRDSVMPGQPGTAVVLGRQLAYGGPLAQINRFVPGDEITVTTGQGTSTFQVINLRRAGDPMPEPLTAGQGRLELQTADGLALFPSGVLYVDAELVSEPWEAAPRFLTYQALPTEERAMGQNTQGLFAAFFVFVFFVAAGIGTWWLWRSWGRWHAWLVGVPVLVALGVVTSDLVMNSLPNLL